MHNSDIKKWCEFELAHRKLNCNLNWIYRKWNVLSFFVVLLFYRCRSFVVLFYLSFFCFIYQRIFLSVCLANIRNSYLNFFEFSVLHFTFQIENYTNHTNSNCSFVSCLLPQFNSNSGIFNITEDISQLHLFFKPISEFQVQAHKDVPVMWAAAAHYVVL